MTSKNKIPPQFIVRIATKNESGVVTGHREFILYAGLLAVAHELGDLFGSSGGVLFLRSEPEQGSAVPPHGPQWIEP